MHGAGNPRGRPPTPAQSYQPYYPDDGAASFGVIYAANGPFVACVSPAPASQVPRAASNPKRLSAPL